MLLFKGIPPFKSFSEFPNVDDYTEYLHLLNEQLSILLKLKSSAFSAQFENMVCQNSFVLFIASFVNYFDANIMCERDKVEDWKKEYIEVLEYELIGRVVRLTERFLRIEPAPLLRTLDLTKWCLIAKKFKNFHEDLVYGLLITLFDAGKLLKRQIIRFVSGVDISSCSNDVALLCMLMAASKINVLEVPRPQLASLFLAVSKVGSMDDVMSCLKYLSLLSSWEPISHELVIEMTNDMANENQLSILQDYLISIGISEFTDLAEKIRSRLLTKKNINLLMQTLPKLDSIEAESILLKYNGNTSLAIAKERQRFGEDEFATFLDDKASVKATKEQTINVLLEEYQYEDEYVDTFDEDGFLGQSNHNTKSIDIRNRKNVDNISDLEKSLLQAYTKNPSSFNRSASTRKSKERHALCDRLGLTHEQIEGWAIVFERNPRKEAVISDFLLLHPNFR